MNHLSPLLFRPCLCFIIYLIKHKVYSVYKYTAGLVGMERHRKRGAVAANPCTRAHARTCGGAITQLEVVGRRVEWARGGRLWMESLASRKPAAITGWCCRCREIAGGEVSSLRARITDINESFGFAPQTRNCTPRTKTERWAWRCETLGGKKVVFDWKWELHTQVWMRDNANNCV